MARFPRLATGAMLLGWGYKACGQYFPPTPEGITILQSEFHPDVKISYKEPGICETTPGVKSYSGYVHLPEKSVDEYQTYPINTFFWFFESRKDPANAPLSIWLNGGPGASSIVGLLQENGPCLVNDDSNSTTLNPWSWNNEVNMLYIDQVCSSLYWPVRDTSTGITKPENFSGGVPIQNNTFFVGTFASQNRNTTANSTANAAHALWHFAQTWFAEFPPYKPNNNKISIWAESYGGKYGPSFAAFFEEQNRKIADGRIKQAGAISLHLDTLGIVSGCIDTLTQELSYPHIAFNNTYGIEAINASVYQQAVDDFNKPGGCKEQIIKCRTLAAKYDKDDIGNVPEVNTVCQDADNFCFSHLEEPYLDISNRGYYDMAHLSPDPFPPQYLLGYLSQHWVQGALGVPVNYTEISGPVFSNFGSTGDYTRGGYLEDIGYILNRGIKVALVYGDRDYSCNWIGGEAVSLAVDYHGQRNFKRAGYAPVQVSNGYVGGLVRQFGNFSFTRVFEAGHEIPAYQPETAYEIFQRATFNKDIATGKVSTLGGYEYSSQGPSSTWKVKNAVPPSPAPTCYILDPFTCTVGQFNAVYNGTALIRNYIVQNASGPPSLGVPQQPAVKRLRARQAPPAL
ncbi:hypothetical protein FGG08_001267 [Glutinoglossum americanum]|uniref:Carboxypeptidase n=1 Tax=Glutinoglossum americanum TaxID=1670608 RepID=A0A9P8L6C5_9PEZI|nr:hypothetical protein FGG08_001267 [Glutinoglossum americanum]